MPDPAKSSAMSCETYMKCRVDDQMNWYDNKSIRNRKWFFRFQILTIVISALIPVISLLSIHFDDLPTMLIAGTLGASVTAFAAVTSLCKFQDHWMTYRATCEALKHEKYLFRTKTEPYTDKDAYHRFVQRVEFLISQEHTNWQDMFRRSSSGDNPPG